MKDKMDKLLELLEEINELYPEVDKIVINDPINPDYIILASTEYVNEMAKSMGLEGIEDMADEYDSVSSKPKDKKKLQ